VKKCPKCGKTFDDSWEVCLGCSVQLSDDLSVTPDLPETPNPSSTKKKKLSLILRSVGICCLFVFLVNNGMVRTIARAFIPFPYPEETRVIAEDVVVFDLSKMKPAYLSLKIQYPRGVDLTIKQKGEREGMRGFQMESGIRIKTYKNDKLVEDVIIDSFDKHYAGTEEFHLSEFYSFTWSPPLWENIFGQPHNSRIEIDFNNKYSGYIVTVGDAGIDM
jgi:hypothetical protein